MTRIILAFIVSVAMSAPAYAQNLPSSQSQIGTRFKQKAKTADANEARIMQKNVARCVLYRNKKLTREVLENSDPVSIYFTQMGTDGETLFDDLDVDHCLARAAKRSTSKIYMTIKFRTLRALLAEEAFLMDNKKPITLAPDGEEYIAAREDRAGLHPSAVAMAKYADCIVFNAVDHSDALLRARPGSAKEEAALTALYPTLSKCELVDDEEATIDQSVVRMLVADGLWSRAYFASKAPIEAAE